MWNENSRRSHRVFDMSSILWAESASKFWSKKVISIHNTNTKVLQYPNTFIDLFFWHRHRYELHGSVCGHTFCLVFFARCEFCVHLSNDLVAQSGDPFERPTLRVGASVSTLCLVGSTIEGTSFFLWLCKRHKITQTLAESFTCTMMDHWVILKASQIFAYVKCTSWSLVNKV